MGLSLSDKYPQVYGLATQGAQIQSSRHWGLLWE